MQLIWGWGKIAKWKFNLFYLLYYSEQRNWFWHGSQRTVSLMVFLQCALQRTPLSCRKYKSPWILKTWAEDLQITIYIKGCITAGKLIPKGFWFSAFPLNLEFMSNYSARTAVFLKISLSNQSLETDEGRIGQPNPRLISRRQLCLSFHSDRENKDITQSLEDKKSLSLKDKIY